MWSDSLHIAFLTYNVARVRLVFEVDDDDVVMLNVLRCRLTY